MDIPQQHQCASRQATRRGRSRATYFYYQGFSHYFRPQPNTPPEIFLNSQSIISAAWSYMLPFLLTGPRHLANALSGTGLQSKFRMGQVGFKYGTTQHDTAQRRCNYTRRSKVNVRIQRDEQGFLSSRSR